MKPSDRLVKTFTYLGGAAKAAKLKALGGTSAQYIYKYDEDDYHYKLTADLTSTKAIVTQSVIYEANCDPEIITFELDYDAEADVYPLGIGCPVPSYIYTYNMFNCANERELKMYFSKDETDLGAGSGYVIGTALHNGEAIDLVYPCTKS